MPTRQCSSLLWLEIWSRPSRDHIILSCPSMMTKTEQAGRECVQILTRLGYIGSTKQNIAGLRI